MTKEKRKRLRNKKKTRVLPQSQYCLKITQDKPQLPTSGFFKAPQYFFFVVLLHNLSPAAQTKIAITVL
nr:MAG TPA: hypothetical protein [Caudoviricetes sp.]